MTAGVYNITIEKGSTFSKSLTIKNADDFPVVLTDAAAVRSHLRKTVHSTDFIVFDTVIDDAINGVITWTLTPTQTNSIKYRNGVYDLEIEWSDGRIERLLQGKVYIDNNITRE